MPGKQPVWPPRIYHHKRTGQDRIRVNGKDYYLGAHGSVEAKAEYARLVSELAAKGKAGPARHRPAAPGLTVVEILSRWWRYAKTYYSERGCELAAYRAALRPVERLFGLLPAAAFGTEHLRELQQALISGSWMTDEEKADPRRKGLVGLSRRVINQRIIKVRTTWRWAEEEGIVPKGTWSALRALKPVRANRPGVRDVKTPRMTTITEVRAVCRHLSSLMRAMLLFQWWTGARNGEVRIMRAGDLVQVNGVWQYRPRQHKTDYLGHDRVIFVGRKAMAAIRKQLHGKSGNAPVFPSPGKGGRGGKGAGECYTKFGYCQAIRRAARAAGIPHFHAYLCRHATRMRVSRLGGDEAARAVLGQRHLDTTLRYGSLDEGLARDIQRKIG